MTTTYSARAGTRIDTAIGDAIRVAAEAGEPVSFDFNTVDITVHADSDPELIRRDFHRAMAGCIDRAVGPDPAAVLSDAEQAHDDRIYAEREQRHQEIRAAVKAEKAAKQAAVDVKLADAPPATAGRG